MEVNCGKSIGRNCVDGSKRSNCKIGRRIDSVLPNVGKIRERLNDVAKTVNSDGAALHVFPLARDFKGSFYASVEYRAKNIAAILNRHGQGGVGQEKIWNQAD